MGENCRAWIGGDVGWSFNVGLICEKMNKGGGRKKKKEIHKSKTTNPAVSKVGG
ncbi:hypothetical protein KFK09_023556 [Dendrobium nobile]|uniref:Uncharacterized protein n=1 Tax=Dendrobium nobile TaxID=94219 RepID=A0A8T3AB95_DENNO|nr:hypothetical protein KFK09_023556 [Dendrobium nobile]